MGKSNSLLLGRGGNPHFVATPPGSGVVTGTALLIDSSDSLGSLPSLY